MTSTSPYLIVSGWGGSGDDHWQTVWQQRLAAPRVSLAKWFEPRRDVWLSALDQAVVELACRDPRPPVLVAHSLGCIVVAHWARTACLPVRAAFLVAPADVEQTQTLWRLRGFAPVPDSPLPFSSLVVASDNDPCASVMRAGVFATAWGSDLHVVRGGGHLNAASGLGIWPEGRALLESLLRRTE